MVRLVSEFGQYHEIRKTNFCFFVAFIYAIEGNQKTGTGKKRKENGKETEKMAKNRYSGHGKGKAEERGVGARKGKKGRREGVRRREKMGRKDIRRRRREDGKVETTWKKAQD